MTAERMFPPRAMTSPARQPAVWYYQQQGIIVTNRYLWAGAYRYEIADLIDLTRTRGFVHPGALAGLIIAIGEATFVTPLASILGETLAWVLAAVVGTITTTSAGGECRDYWTRLRSPRGESATLASA
jgi:hypothetical protein